MRSWLRPCVGVALLVGVATLGSVGCSGVLQVRSAAAEGRWTEACRAFVGESLYEPRDMEEHELKATLAARLPTRVGVQVLPASGLRSLLRLRRPSPYSAGDTLFRLRDDPATHRYLLLGVRLDDAIDEATGVRVSLDGPIALEDAVTGGTPGSYWRPAAAPDAVFRSPMDPAARRQRLAEALGFRQCYGTGGGGGGGGSLLGAFADLAVLTLTVGTIDPNLRGTGEKLLGSGGGGEPPPCTEPTDLQWRTVDALVTQLGSGCPADADTCTRFALYRYHSPWEVAALPRWLRLPIRFEFPGPGDACWLEDDLVVPLPSAADVAGSLAGLFADGPISLSDLYELDDRTPYCLRSDWTCTEGAVMTGALCWLTSDCASGGRCTAAGSTCRATSHEACQGSSGCRIIGRCDLEPTTSTCVPRAGMHEPCGELCGDLGLCAHRPGATGCHAPDDAACAGSTAMDMMQGSKLSSSPFCLARSTIHLYSSTEVSKACS